MNSPTDTLPVDHVAARYRTGRAAGWLVFVALCVLTCLIYWPATHGAYVFDDGIYFVDNVDVHVSSLKLGEWINAALSQAGNYQFRALSMLTFAANFFFRDWTRFGQKSPTSRSTC